MQKWEYRRIIITNKAVSRIQIMDSLKGRTNLENVGFTRSPDHAAKIADYLNEAGKEGWEIAFHAITDGLADEVVTLKRVLSE